MPDPPTITTAGSAMTMTATGADIVGAQFTFGGDTYVATSLSPDSAPAFSYTIATNTTTDTPITGSTQNSCTLSPPLPTSYGFFCLNFGSQCQIRAFWHTDYSSCSKHLNLIPNRVSHGGGFKVEMAGGGGGVSTFAPL